MILFEDDSLVVRGSEGFQGQTCVFSFSYRWNRRKQPYTRAELGFSETFLQKRGIPHVCFIAKQNHWWQTSSLPDALDRAWSEVGRRHERFVSYGASMGGYGAMLAASFLSLDRVVAFYPQASIREELVSDDRWRIEQNMLTPYFDDLAFRVPSSVELYIIYDPFHDLDARHVRLLRSRSSPRELHVGLSGHSTLLILSRIGMLTSLVEQLIAGGEIPENFRSEFRRRRRGKSMFYTQAAANLKLKNHELLSERYSRRAKRMAKREAAIAAALSAAS